MPENLAPVGARVLAFAFDLGLAAAGYFASLKALYPRQEAWGSPHGPIFVTLWIGIFLLYHAFMSCEGRRTAGKALLGLRVTDAAGEPLEAGRAAVRSAAYLASSVANLGFAWTMVDGKRRGWHDLIAGTVVVEDEPSSPARRRLLNAGGALCAAGFLGLWYWRQIVVPRYERALRVSAAHALLEEMGVLERYYHDASGVFTTKASELATVSTDPDGFRRGLPALVDAAYGVRISTGARGYEIRARATDDARTPVSIRWP